MFEMKNEGDETETKKKNERFFKELDKDKNEKKVNRLFSFLCLKQIMSFDSRCFLGI